MHSWQLRSIGFHWSDQLDLDFFLDHLQPLFSSRGAALNTFDLAFQLADPLLSGSQLNRNAVRQGHRSLDVVFRQIRSILDQSKKGLPYLINRFLLWRLLRRKPHERWSMDIPPYTGGS